MGERRFQHDCHKCEFLGHFLGHDVYQCRAGFRSVIARHGDGANYVSFPGETLTETIQANGDIIPHSDIEMFKTDALAMLMGLACKALKKGGG